MSAGLAALMLAAPAAAETWQPSLDGIGEAGSDKGGGGLDLMVPLYQDGSTLLLANALGGLDSDSAQAASFGLVLRHRFEAGYILGGYAYGDFQRSSNGEAFPQFVAGLEFKTADWDLHVTGYVPFGDVKTVQWVAPTDAVSGTFGPGQLVIDGNQLLLRHLAIGAVDGADGLRVEEAALFGGEAAVGWRLPVDRALGHTIDANIYLGGYAFGRDGFESYIGPEARLELQVHDLAFMGDGSRLTASLETSWDDPRGLQGAGLLRVRIPLGTLFGEVERHETDRLDRRMVDPVQRDLIALTDERSQVLAAATAAELEPFDEAVRDAETDRTIALVYFADGGAAVSDGSAADPTSVADAVGTKGITGNAATDALIVVSGQAGPITANVDLAGNQILLGGGSTLQVRGNTTNELATFNPTAFNAAASRPTFQHDGTASEGAITASGVNRVKLVGLDITIASKSPDANLLYYGVFLNDTSHDIVRDVQVTGGDAAFLNAAFMAASDDLLFEDIGATGSGVGFAVFSNGAGTNRVSNLTVNTATFDSLVMNGGAAARAVYTDAVGAQSSTSIALNDITVTNTLWGAQILDVDGLTIDGWTGTGLDSSSSGSVGLHISSGNNATVRDFSLTGYRAGIQFVSNGTGNAVDGSTRGIIADIGTSAAAGTAGILFSATDGTVDNVTISGVGSAGVTDDVALQINGPSTVRITNLAVDGQNSGGANVTDRAVFLSGNLATDDITIQAGSDGNTAVNVGALCLTVMGAGSVTGQVTFTTPAASQCP